MANIHEWLCKTCGETFVDAPPADDGFVMEHGQREDGTPCESSDVEYKGSWG